jgi:hypothetical protein
MNPKAMRSSAYPQALESLQVANSFKNLRLAFRNQQAKSDWLGQ